LILQLLRGLVLGGAVKNRSSMVLDVADGSERTWMRVAEVEIGSVGVFLAAAAIWIDGRWSRRRLSVVGPGRSGTRSGLGCFFVAGRVCR
jgi:hypothetical protein